MADIKALANKRSRAIIAVTRHPGFCPIDKAFRNPLKGDFTLIPSLYYVPSSANPRVFELRTEFREGLDKRVIRVPNGTIYIYSQDKPENGVYEGAVILIDVQRAGKYLADGTHKIATQEQIVNYLRMLQANNRVIEQKELQRDPVAYQARMKAEAEGRIALEGMQNEGRLAFMPPPERNRVEPEDKYHQEDDDWGTKSKSNPRLAAPTSDDMEQINPPGFDSEFSSPLDPSMEDDFYPDPDGSRTHTITHSQSVVQSETVEEVKSGNSTSVPPVQPPLKPSGTKGSRS